MESLIIAKIETKRHEWVGEESPNRDSVNDSFMKSTGGGQDDKMIFKVNRLVDVCDNSSRIVFES